jgi:glycosyltransferase involved in cell wall biosynthesis
MSQRKWAYAQRDLLPRYTAIVVASDHMRREYVRHGVDAERVVANPLFATVMPTNAGPAPAEFRVLFLGRMTSLKGGDVLIRAAALASAQLGAVVSVTLAGDGPSRAAWEALSISLQVSATFPGWVNAEQRAALYSASALVAVPSVWPEPFGLTGLEGGAYGVPAVAFDVGGISMWLRGGENGWLVDPRTGAEGMATAIAEAYTDSAMLGARRVGARRVAEEFSIERHVAVLERIFGAAMARGSKE